MSQKLKQGIMLTALVLSFLLGIGIMVYPLLSTRYTESRRSEVHTQYKEQVALQDNRDLEQIRKSAHEYNQHLASGEFSILTPEENGYYQEMIIPGVTQTMGYIKIPRLNIELPIYHGVGTDALNTGCGHMPQSSLPVGGNSTHSVISAHTGMANSKMFSDLPLMEVGDIFQLDVLGETLTYQVLSDADIQTVLPHEVNQISIRTGEDLCTLVTCVPFGVNTHRLLVTGHRVPNPVEPSETSQANIHNADSEVPDSIWEHEYKQSLLVGFAIMCIGIASAVCILGIISLHRKSADNRKQNIDDEINISNTPPD